MYLLVLAADALAAVTASPAAGEALAVQLEAARLFAAAASRRLHRARNGSSHVVGACCCHRAGVHGRSGGTAGATGA